MLSSDPVEVEAFGFFPRDFKSISLGPLVQVVERQLSESCGRIQI
jgi:hypothetical protein